MNIVDCHVHVWQTEGVLYPPPAILSFLPPPGPTPELLLREMAQSGVQQAVLVQPSNYEYDSRYIAESLRRFPGRFAGVGALDAVSAAAPARLTLWAEQRGVRGLRIAPFAVMQGAWVNDRYAYPLWEKASELSIPVCFQSGQGRIGALAEMVERLATHFPQLKVAFDHMGHFEVAKGVAHGDFTRFLALARHKNVFIKVSGQYALSHDPYPYRDTWLFMQVLYERFGAERMMWGTDFPYILAQCGYAKALALVRDELPFLTSQDKEWILGKTASTLWDF